MHHENYIDIASNKQVAVAVVAIVILILIRQCLFLIYVLFEYIQKSSINMQTHMAHIEGKHNHSFRLVGRFFLLLLSLLLYLE